MVCQRTLRHKVLFDVQPTPLFYERVAVAQCLAAVLDGNSGYVIAQQLVCGGEYGARFGA